MKRTTKKQRESSLTHTGLVNMKEIIIGIDPDSDKHGVAFYVDGKLEDLRSWSLVDFNHYLSAGTALRSKTENIEFHIENTLASNKIFVSSIKGYRCMSRAKQEMALQSRARKLGKCQQAQIELERVISNYNIKIVHHKISKNWKDSKTGKMNLERHCGWTCQSNEDTRSAAWFGYLGVQMNKRGVK